MPMLSSLLKWYFALNKERANLRFEIILCGTNKTQGSYDALARMVPWVVTPLEFNVNSVELLSHFTGRPPVCLACEKMPKFVLLNSDCQLLTPTDFSELEQLPVLSMLTQAEEVVRRKKKPL